MFATSNAVALRGATTGDGASAVGGRKQVVAIDAARSIIGNQTNAIQAAVRKLVGLIIDLAFPSDDSEDRREEKIDMFISTKLASRTKVCDCFAFASVN